MTIYVTMFSCTPTQDPTCRYTRNMEAYLRKCKVKLHKVNWTKLKLKVSYLKRLITTCRIQNFLISCYVSSITLL